MQENGNNIDKTIELVKEKISQKRELFREEISKEIYNLEKKIGDQMKNIGISETGLINKEITFQKSLANKILLGVHYCTLGLGTLAIALTVGLFY